jgi:TorA maturation chaperone TorD
MELLRALGAVVEVPGEDQHRVAEALGLPAPSGAAEHTTLFRLQLPPFASIYLNGDGMLGGDARDRAAGFWRALGATPPPEPDHLTTVLAAHASLVEHDDGAGSPRWRAARHAFFWEHLASWLPPYLTRVVELGDPFQRAWADLLREALAAEAERLGPPAALPVALAHAPTAPTGREAPDLMDGILAPIRTGLILTRGDLAAAARSLGLGVRQGERRFILGWLVRQDPPAVLGWLAQEASRQAELWPAAGPVFRPVLDHWRARALSTARALESSARETPLPPQEAAHA